MMKPWRARRAAAGRRAFHRLDARGFSGLVDVAYPNPPRFELVLATPLWGIVSNASMIESP